MLIEGLEQRCLLSAASGEFYGASGKADVPNGALEMNYQDVAEVVPLMTTSNDPANYVAAPGQFYDGIPLDGVVRREMTSPSGGMEGVCSGSVLPDGRHILTAAHCVANFPLGSVKGTIEWIQPDFAFAGKANQVF